MPGARPTRTRRRPSASAWRGNTCSPGEPTGSSDRPWRPAPVPTSAVDLVQFALWRSGDLAPADLLSALTLMPAARAEVDGLEDGLLFVARSAGLTWAQIAEAMGFRSRQACQQHYARLAARREAAS